MTRSIAGLLAAALVAALAAVVYSGVVDPGADTPHPRPLHWLLETVRERGISTRAASIEVPDLADPELVRLGAGNYDAMCAACHLKPGVTDSELHRGLYPQPPSLANVGEAPARQFWVIKHGIKATGMPAWGKSMDDRAIWGLVAFLQALPKHTPESYGEAVEHSEGHHHDEPESQPDHDHDHDHSEM
ncbi:MAG: cytochrome c [Gammaproteobacteria bacterium]